jgi:hypothetical protein
MPRISTCVHWLWSVLVCGLSSEVDLLLLRPRLRGFSALVAPTTDPTHGVHLPTDVTLWAYARILYRYLPQSGVQVPPVRGTACTSRVCLCPLSLEVETATRVGEVWCVHGWVVMAVWLHGFCVTELRVRVR